MAVVRPRTVESMDKRVRSGINFDGSAMRYAEVEQAGSSLRLHRLGSCDFDFDAEAAVYRGNNEQVATVREALKDVFSGTTSSHFTIVVPASECVAFFSPLSSELDEDARRSHLESEARLVFGTEEAMAVTSDAVREERGEEEDVVWHHVAAMPESSWARLTRLLDVFEDGNYRYLTRPQSAARVARAVTSTDAHEGVQVIVGRAGEYTEVGIVQAGKLRSSEVASVADVTDVCYHVLALIKRAGVEPHRVGEVLLYGDHDGGLEVELKKLVAPAVLRLDPLSIMSNAPQNVSFDPVQYVLCIGGAL